MAQIPTGRIRAARGGMKRSEQLAREILGDVCHRALKPGTLMPTESVMLEQYDVSRGTLREALRILEVHGLITIRPGPSGGPRIANMAAAQFARTATFYYEAMGASFGDLVETRVLLEPMMARMAAEKRTAQDILDLKEVLSQAQAQARDGAVAGESLRLSVEFHHVLARVCGNPVLEMLDGSLEEIFDMYSLNELPQPENLLHVRAHERIAEAVIDGDGDLAEQRMRKHMREFARDFAERNPTILGKVVDWV